MKLTSIIMIVASCGLILIGLFIIKSKALSKTMIIEGNESNSIDFIRKNGMLNIIVGSIGVVLSVIDQITEGWSIILVLTFVVLVFSLSIIQYALAKKYRNNLK